MLTHIPTILICNIRKLQKLTHAQLLWLGDLYLALTKLKHVHSGKTKLNSVDNDTRPVYVLGCIAVHIYKRSKTMLKKIKLYTESPQIFLQLGKSSMCAPGISMVLEDKHVARDPNFQQPLSTVHGHLRLPTWQ